MHRTERRIGWVPDRGLPLGSSVAASSAQRPSRARASARGEGEPIKDHRCRFLLGHVGDPAGEHSGAGVEQLEDDVVIAGDVGQRCTMCVVQGMDGGHLRGETTGIVGGTVVADLPRFWWYVPPDLLGRRVRPVGCLLYTSPSPRD